LTLLEHSLRWAQYRVDRQRPAQPAGSPASVDAHRDGRSAKSIRQAQELAGYLIPLYDRNRNGTVESSELRTAGRLDVADGDRNGAVTSPELADWLGERLSKQRGSVDDLPAWFLAADENLDGQLTLAEHLRGRPQASTAVFDQHDGNGDGIITTKELASSDIGSRGHHSCRRPQVIEAGGRTSAEILIHDKGAVGDIDVQLALAKNGDDDVEIALIGPAGARADLYFDSRTKPWGGGRLFDNTTIDDEAPDIPQKLPRPPVPRCFRSQGLKTAGMQGLKVFYGKPAAGTWRLVIYNRSQVAGLLERWALVIKLDSPRPKP
jgi:subtilisin-like proprotein convertase family protein